MIALLDCDIIAYRSAASVEQESLELGIYRVNDLVSRILQRVGATEHEAHLSGTTNYRKQICPEYKANRTQVRPKFLEPLREHLVAEWQARLTDGCEADDAIAISAGKYFKEDIPFTVCSLDKDLKQIPGKHYRWEFAGTSSGKQWIKPEESFYVTPLDGLKFFYRQLLIGDTSDNVIGVNRIGKVGAAKHIDHLETELEMFECVRGLYNDDERLLKNGQLLWLQRTENELWQFPAQ